MRVGLGIELREWSEERRELDITGQKLMTQGHFGRVPSLIWIINDRIQHEYFKHYYNIILEKLMIEISFRRSHLFRILKWQITLGVVHQTPC
jgi:hypothetical protein